MLEKIGLPAKPSMRGANWVIDASHCQGCSSPFTFFNRKHHCRRCGGIFCNTCTQQRMVLRGQGDSPVRICDPCKKLEEAARFELRYGHKNKAAKGSSKQIPDAEDELLSEILHTDSKHSMSFANASHSLSDLSDTGNSVVHANLPTVLESSNSVDGHIDSPTGVTCSPEDLRQQVMEEKKKYRLLKAEGKSDEALRAFKHGKELERQAVALEITIRKARRMTGKKVSTISNMVSTDRIDDHGIDKKIASSKGEEVRDDLFTELRQLGWSDTELHDSEKKTGKLSLEGELSSLLGETSEKSGTGRKKGGMDRSQVVAHKRKALLLKREGKLAEAKEELKQAKILERQLEEQEFLGDASDSEDELYTLINNMDDDDNQEDLMLKNPLDDGKNFDYLLGTTDDLPIDDNLEVTDNDMNDPELSAALKSFGWTEEDEEHGSVREEDLQAKVLKLKKEALNLKQEGKLPEAMTLLKKVKLLEQDLGNLLSEPHILDLGFTKRTDDNKTSAPKSKIVIQKELLALKRKALTLRREGRVEEADEELKKGKILEQQLEVLENPLKIPSTKWMEPTRDQPIDPGSLFFSVDIAETEATDQDMHDPSMLSALKSLGWNEDESDSLSTTLNASKHSSVPLPCKSTRNKGETQRELLAVKRKALSLRRQGKAEEAEEELMKAKDLERQLADLEQSVPAIKQEKPTIRDAEDNSSKVICIETNKIDDSTKPIVTPSNSESKAPKAAITVSSESDQIVGENSSSFSKETDCYKEDILTHKRTALALKREGKLIEAKEELRKAKLLEKALLEGQGSSIDDKTAAVSTSESTSTMLESKTHVQKPKSSRDRFKLQQESLAHKRNALKLRREGKIQEADAESEKAKELESQLEEVGAPGPSNSTSHGVLDTGIVEDFLDPQLMSALKSIGWDDKDLLTKPTEKTESQSSTKNVSSNQSHIDGTHLEGQIKAIKIRALNLKRAGKQDEALDALREAKKLEKKLNLSN